MRSDFASVAARAKPSIRSHHSIGSIFETNSELGSVHMARIGREIFWLDMMSGVCLVSGYPGASVAFFDPLNNKSFYFLRKFGIEVECFSELCEIVRNKIVWFSFPEIKF